MISIRITSLYGSHPSSAVYACKTATLRPELQVSIGPRPHLWFFAFKVGTLAPELQIAKGPSPHLRCLHEKQRLLDQIYKSLLVPAIICGFVHKNSEFSIRNTSLYGSQLSFVAFASKTATLGPEIQVSMGPRPYQWFFAFKRATLAPELQVSMYSRPHLPFCAWKTTWLASELLVSIGPSPNL